MDLELLQTISRVGTLTLAGPAVLLGVWAGVRMLRRGRRRLCPGQRGARWRWMLPSRWFFSRPCGYDLAGLPSGVAGRTKCPECGCEVEPAAALRQAHRTHPGRLAVVLVLMIAIVRAGPMAKQSRWQRQVPTAALIVMKRALGTELMPTRLRRELDFRLQRNELWGWQARLVIPALQADLRADGAQGNAYRALDHLERLGAPGRAALERSLKAMDRQERQLAAYRLRWMCYDRQEGKRGPLFAREPSDDLLRVLVEGLADDEINYSNGGVDNAFGGFSFLIRFPDRALPYVAQGLGSDDDQQRLLCAALVAYWGKEELFVHATPTLVEHLADNRYWGDAALAAKALYWAGERVAPALATAAEGGDEQRFELARAVLRGLPDRPASYGRLLNEVRRRVRKEPTDADDRYGWGGLGELGYGWEMPDDDPTGD